MPSTEKDVLIIGGGHNGLVAAFYLAQAGLKPLVLERREEVGGAALSQEFFPGFRCPTLAHACGPLRPEIVRSMELQRYGLEMLEPAARLLALGEDGRALLLSSDATETSRSLAQFSARDAAQFEEFQRVLARLAEALGALVDETPLPLDGTGAQGLWRVLKTGKRLRGLGERDFYRLLRWVPMPVADLVSEWFESELLRAALAAQGIFGNFMGPASAGSSAVLLLRALADAHPAGSASFPKGGMSALGHALAAAAQRAGAEIRTGAEVERITVKNGAATGVALAGGEEIQARLVVSNADPKRTFLRLLGAEHLDPAFLIQIRNYRSTGSVAKVNLALASLPSFTALKGASNGAAALAGRIHIGPTLEYLERAFDDGKYGAPSRRPVLEAAIPSLADSSLVPPGRHVMSVYAQFAPFRLKQGDWNSRREELGDAVVATLASCAPDLPGLILHRQVITPLDLEKTYGLTGGHIFHGDLALDQLFSLRPLLGWAQYRTPLRGLYLCGAGTHPGWGLTGASGRNAARQILKDLKKDLGS